QITDLDGRVAARSASLGSARLPTPPELLARLRGGETVFSTVTDFAEPIRMVSLPIDIGQGRYAVEVAMSLYDPYAATRIGRWLFLIWRGVTRAVAAPAGGALARRPLRRRAGGGPPPRRSGEATPPAPPPHPGTADEIGRLVETLNEMLERLERSFEVRRMFS